MNQAAHLQNFPSSLLSTEQQIRHILKVSYLRKCHSLSFSNKGLVKTTRSNYFQLQFKNIKTKMPL